jgi:hypothetical protein
MSPHHPVLGLLYLALYKQIADGLKKVAKRKGVCRTTSPYIKLKQVEKLGTDQFRKRGGESSGLLVRSGRPPPLETLLLHWK